ncbi:LysR family transcriptional regulator [Celerinatantimonas diazotrophica]|uniref:DNA-binding transcriptional LysR family regulator n=1 Tax=Celerinatantimonas diazotrophica TaxID=412034 RepID=A0A4R1K1D0_9GAMM|nr:LysR family transcriptional regulator [Celerinatantimonas diazotrophica]TCK57784.1 DNA-binding transcriptional LysR family regulator [Celerinatantimonas diazotrophica]CAG9298152.1 HTH-type transcriptional regulator YofA [Celerinatantimonas diazotrophica]
MDMDALKGFLAFVETGSFTRAAKQVHRTQSAFSAQMHKLENELNVQLFEKQGRNLVLSEAGIALRGYAQQLTGLHHQALKQVRRYENKRPLHLGCPDDFNQVILPQVVTLIRRMQPTCSIQVFSHPSTTLRTWLDEGKLDAAIVTRASGSEEGYYLTYDQGVWVSAPEFNMDEHPSLPLVLFQSDCHYQAAAIDRLTKQGRAHQLMTCCDSASALCAIVRQGLGISAMGRLSVSDDLKILSQMPALPSVEIALVLGAHSHPLFDEALLSQLASCVKR